MFTTCYGNRNEPDITTDLAAVFEHNGIPVKLVSQKCCGMPKLELGDLETVARHKDTNIPALKRDRRGLRHRRADPVLRADVQAGTAADVPGGRGLVQAVKARIFDPFEYLMLRHKAGCSTEDGLQGPARQGQLPRTLPPAGAEPYRTQDPRRPALVPDTTVEVIERCSGHNGTYAVKQEFREASVKIGKPVVGKVEARSPTTTPAIARWRASDRVRPSK